MGTSYDKMIGICREASDLNKAGAVLSWDQETLMPPKGAGARGRQLSVLSGTAHARFTSEDMGAAIRGAEQESLSPPAAANVREIRRTYDRMVKVPGELVREMTETSVVAREKWREARTKNEFPLFAPLLRRTIELKKRYADCVGYPQEPYDALIDDYEPGMTASRVSGIFDDLRARLLPVVAKIRASKTPPRTDFLHRTYPREGQEAVGRKVLEQMRFDFQAGRMDVSTHPFTTAFSPADVRLTTRYDEKCFPMAFFGTMHEGGHALYEQGLRPEHEGTPLGEAVSLGIHESQSRLWENMVGRSLPFWRHFYPRLQARLKALAGVPLLDFVRAVNRVEPSLIRVEADEVTYNLHIALRFELELALVRGDLAVKDLPAAWGDRTQELLGLRPARDAEGALQDVHWAWGELGYFPTYTIGNLYAASLFAAARRELPDLEADVGEGRLLPLRDWLRERVHRFGRSLPAEEIVRRACGRGLCDADFRAYLEAKYAALEAGGGA